MSEKIKCPICKGKGEIPRPARERRLVDNRVMARLLSDAGYSVREIMRFLGYKSPRSVQVLLKAK